MTTIAQMSARWNSLSLHKEVNMTIRQTTGDIIKANQNQLLSNKDSTGESLGGYALKSYEDMKKDMGQSGVVDLKLTGDFYKGFQVDVQQDTFELDSTDSKTGKLEGKYGKDIFGLTPESRENYTFGVFWKGLKEKLEAILRLQFV
jgi:hypothetical protein